MKNKIVVSLLAFSIGIISAVSVQAQDTTTAGQDIKNAAKKSSKAVKKEARKVGNKTAEVASNTKSAVVDKVYDGKQGPDGEKIYIDGKSRYYYVDKKGHKQYLPARKLKDN